jgi:hypothetical protein
MAENAFWKYFALPASFRLSFHKSQIVKAPLQRIAVAVADADIFVFRNHIYVIYVMRTGIIMLKSGYKNKMLTLYTF